MKRFYFLFFTSFILVSTLSLAQQKLTPAKRLVPANVKGTIKLMGTNETAIGATIIVKGQRRGTITDLDGNFSLNATELDTLVCSFIGYEDLLVPVGNQSVLMIALQPSSKQLDGVEVVAVGYGSIDRAKLSGSVATLKGDKLAHEAVSIDNALAGKIPGVLVNPTSGQPGSATSITIRGISTFQKDGNNPLFVIDGVPIYGSNSALNSNNYEDRRSIPAAGFGGTHVGSTFDTSTEFERNPLAHLNPEDIESIEVLKDAYATAIYGSRGAAGVILVTTKKGKRGEGEIKLKYEVGVDQPVGLPDLMNGYEYAKFYSAYHTSLTGGIPVRFDTTNNVNWVDKVVRPVVSQRFNLSLSGGGEKSKYFTSLAYQDLPSYIRNQEFKKMTARINYSYEPLKFIETGANMQFGHTDNQALNAQQIYYNAVLKAPNVPVKDEDGNYIWDSDDWDGDNKTENAYGEIDNNPIAIADENINYIKDNRLVGNLFLKFNIRDWLVLKSEGGVDVVASEAYSREMERPQLTGGSAVQTTRTNIRTVFNNTLTINKSFDKHDFDLVAGYSFESSQESYNRLTGAEFLNDELLSIGSSASPQVAGSSFNEWALESYFARLNYVFNSKYILGVTYRLDGSSKFAKNHQYVGFPSFSAGWMVSEELFMRRLKWIEQLKLRGSFGFSGINAAGQSYYGTQGTYDLNATGYTYGETNSLEITQPVNPNLKWEKTSSLDLGLDVSLWGGALSFTFEYYNKLTKNLLFDNALSPYKGFTTVEQNVGVLRNYGLELTLNGFVQIGEFSWRPSINIARNMNKIIELNNDGEQIGDASFFYKYMKEGESVGSFYMYQWAGVNPENGQAQWIDKDGNITETPPAYTATSNQHRKVMGNNLPDFFGGFNNNFRYKNWTLDAFFNFSYGQYMINGTRAALLTYTTEDATNLSTEMLDYWKEEGDQTDIPKLRNSSIIRFSGGSTTDYLTSRDNSRFLEESSYLRLKSLTLGYSIPQRLLPGAWVSRLQIYVRGANLWTLTNYSGIDPEVTMGGSSALYGGADEITMPQVKSYAMGVNITF